MAVGIFIGSLTAAPADVLCTSTSSQLSSFKGADAALRKAGGSALRDACKSVLEREEARTGRKALTPGSAAATGPGPLPFQAVVHCVTFDTSGTSPEIIKHATENALVTAAGLKPRPTRVALSVMAADNGQHDYAAALQLMAAAIQAATHVQFDELWIVLPDRKHLSAAQAAFRTSTVVEEESG